MCNQEDFQSQSPKGGGESDGDFAILLGVLPPEMDGSWELKQAFVHRSAAQERQVESNERLEFLGDAVLGVCVAGLLYHRFPSFDEGRLSKMRASVVRSEALAGVARRLRLGEVIELSTTERAGAGDNKDSILADAFEAMVGAIYLRCGLPKTAAFLEQQLGHSIDLASQDRVLGDYKSSLQERLAALGLEPPQYVDAWEGPDHARHFTATVYIESEAVAIGYGVSKKAAQQDAARQALHFESIAQEFLQ